MVARPAFANPEGGTVSVGAANIVSSGKTLSVNQITDKALIDWRRFDIQADETTIFNQPNSSSIALNRIHSDSPSLINGALKANGRIILINQNGVVFGAGSRVDANSLVVSTSNLSNANFEQGHYRFDAPGKSDARIVNDGHITAHEAGLVGLVAPNIENAGVIEAKLGKVQLASGDLATLDFYGDGLFEVGVSNAVSSQLIRHSGRIDVAGGQVAITAAAGADMVNSLITVTGEVHTPSIAMRQGSIVIAAAGSNAVAGNRAADKGITQGRSTVMVGGSLAATGLNAGEKGGAITITGDDITLTHAARLDTSGDSGGGTILVGGGTYGLGVTPRSLTTIVDSGAILNADALGAGNGGTIVSWGDRSNISAGTFLARGGAQGGDGGFIETSAVGTINFDAIKVDASSARGNAGLWLIDPQDLTINAAGASSIATTLNGGTSVTATTSACNVTFGTCTGSAGNITLSSAIAKTAGGNATLTLTADNDIILNAGISATAGQLAVTLNATGNISGNSSGTIATNGGLLTTNVGSGSGTLAGVISGTGALTKTGAGTLTLSGANTYSGATTINAGTLGFTANQNSTRGVTVASGATLSLANNAAVSSATNGRTSIAGTVTGNGTLRGYSGAAGNVEGLLLTGSPTITASGGNLTLAGIASGGSVRGIALASGANVTTNGDASGNVIFSASGTGSAGSRRAFILLGNATVNAATGNLTVNMSDTADVRFFPQTHTLTLGGTQNWNINSAGFSDVWTGSNGRFNLTASPNAVLTFNAGANGTVSNMNNWSWNLGSGSTVSINQVSLNGTFSLIGTGTLTGNIGLTNNSTISSASGSPVISGIISGAFNLAKSGAGTLILSGANTYSGTTTISAGTLQIGNGGTTGTLGTGGVTNNATLAFNRSDALTVTNVISGTGAVTKAGAGTTTLTGVNTYSGGTTVSTGTLAATVNTTQNSIGTGAASVASGATLQLNNTNTSSSAVTVANTFTGLGTLVLNFAAGGSARNTILNALTGFTGNVNLTTSTTTNDKLNLGSNIGGALTINNATTLFLQASRTITGGVSVIGDGNLEGLGAIRADNATLTGPITLTGNSSIGANTGTTGTIAGIISGAFRLTKLAAGTMVLSGANTYSGGTTVSGGTLRAGSTSAFGNNSAMLVDTGTFLDLNGFSNSVGSLAGAGTVTTGVVGSVTLTTGGDNTSTSFSGVIQNGSGTTALTKAGSGTFTLSGANTYTGGTNINAGILNVGSGGALSSSGTISFGGGTLQHSASNTTDYSGRFNSGGSQLISIDTNGQNVTYASAIAGASSSLTKLGTGTLTLSGANSYTGTTTVNGGTLALGASNALADATALTVNSGGTFDLAGFTDTIASLSSVLGSIVTLGNGSLTTTGAQNYGGQVTGGTVTLASTGGGAITAENASNDFTGTLTLNSSGAISVVDANALTLGSVSASTLSARTLAAAADLTLGGNISAGATSGISVILVAGRDLINSGSHSITTAGTARWNIFSGDGTNATQTTGGLTGANRYGCSYNAGSPSCAVGTDIPASGNVFYYAFAPTLSVTGLTADNKVYDTLLGASLTGTAALSGAVNGDTVTFTGTGVGSFADKNVGNGKAVSVTGYALSGTNQGYLLIQPTGLTADITRADLNITGLTALSRVYDATTVAGLSGTASITALGMDALTLNGTGAGAFADKNVGNGKAVTVTGFSLSGADAGNYTLIQPAGLTANITRADLNITGLTALNRVYDATTVTGLSGTAAITALGMDALTLNGTGVGAFADKNVGNGKAVTVTGFSLSGADAGNYTLIQPSGLTADITRADLNITGLTALSRVYDATTVAGLSGTAAIAALGMDALILNGTGVGAFADKNVGNGKAVTVTGFTLSGADAGNYTLIQPAGLTANITKADLNITGLTALNKVYDSFLTATLSGTAAITALGIDALTLNGTGVGAFADKDVGNGKAVTLTGFSLSGADAGNYTLLQPSGLTANITRADLNVTGLTALSRVYDASTVAGLSGTAAITALGMDALTLNGTGVGAFATKDVGTGKAVTVTGFSLSGADAGNYTLLQPSGFTADITKAVLVATAASQTVVAGAPIPTTTVSYASFLGSDTIADIDTLASVSSAQSGNAVVGSFVGNYTPFGAVDNNYSFSYISGDLTVTDTPPASGGSGSSTIPNTVFSITQPAISVFNNVHTEVATPFALADVLDYNNDIEWVNETDDYAYELVIEGVNLEKSILRSPSAITRDAQHNTIYIKRRAI